MFHKAPHGSLMEPAVRFFEGNAQGWAGCFNGEKICHGRYCIQKSRKGERVKLLQTFATQADRFLVCRNSIKKAIIR